MSLNEIELLREELQHHKRMVEVLHSVSSQINTTLDLNDILQNVFELLNTYFGFEHIMILLIDPDVPDHLTLTACYGYEEQGAGATVKFGQGIIGIVAKNRRLLRMSNLKQRMLYARFITETVETVPLPGIPDCASQLAVPLLTGDELLGVLSVESRDVSQFQKKDENLLQMAGTQIAIAIKNAHQYKWIQKTNTQLQDLNENLESKVAVRTRRIAQQNTKLEATNLELKKSLDNLRKTQEKLIESEKLASLGQLTAGIAHEIKNPLNFVNNFAELSIEMIEECREELSSLSTDLSSSDDEKIREALAILEDIETNLSKIHEHGSRADRIVKSMLQHSRGSTGERTKTNISQLLKEYVNLSFHGMRSSAKTMNCDLQFELDDSLPHLNVISEDIARVIVNICQNAFDAMFVKLVENNDYTPILMAKTKNGKSGVIVEISDNGTGIPKEIIDKIMQPFFTTKKGTEGTGLGLSITNDIVKSHGGSIEIESNSEGSMFSIFLPFE